MPVVKDAGYVFIESMKEKVLEEIKDSYGDK